MKTPFRMRPHDVHVWTLRLDLSRTTHDRLERVISADEAVRAARFVVAADRTRYAAAHGLLRVVLSGYLGVRPEEVVFERGIGGKPCVASRRVRFSLSHSGARGLVAVSAEREVGVDIERIRELGDVEGLARRCFSPLERAALSAVPPSQRQAAFFAGWTRKEAFLKVLGEGLSRPLDSFDVTLKPGEPARLLRDRGAPAVSGRYALRALRTAPRYVAALAIDGCGASIRGRPWSILAAVLEEIVVPRAADPAGAGSGSPSA